MIRMLTAHTFEIEDTDAAVREIQEQLRSQGNLLKNTVGLLFCCLDFIQSGTAEAVCKALPFDTLGCTTLGAAISGVAGDLILTLTVLTSDDVEFHTGLSDPLAEDEEGRIVKLYRNLAAPLQGPPSLIFVITPSLYNLAGDTVVGVLDRESRGAPVFGTGALDADTKIRTPKTLYKGTVYADRMPILLFSGNLAPRFFVDSVWKYNIYSQKALVTGAEGNRMISVNNIPAVEYMKKIGLITEARLDLLFVFPLALDPGDGSPPKLFIIYTINDDGSLTCSANTPAGSVIYIGSPGSSEVINSAKNITGAVKKAGGDAALIFSCFSRSVILTNPKDEMEAIQDDLKDSALPYVLIYSGGEICPVRDEKGAAV
ncbi:MAG: FIST C-terminal domain-containing protein, partial [Treponema sp.]|nr:FIST C-terminal domain-containing protein [Treponema sp.]